MQGNLLQILQGINNVKEQCLAKTKETESSFLRGQCSGLHLGRGHVISTSGGDSRAPPAGSELRSEESRQQSPAPILHRGVPGGRTGWQQGTVPPGLARVTTVQ